MTQNFICPDCGHPQIQLALFDPDLSLYCEACDAESLGEVDRNYPSGDVSQEFENGTLEPDLNGGSRSNQRSKPNPKPL